MGVPPGVRSAAQKPWSEVAGFDSSPHAAAALVPPPPPAAPVSAGGASEAPPEPALLSLLSLCFSQLLSLATVLTPYEELEDAQPRVE